MRKCTRPRVENPACKGAVRLSYPPEPSLLSYCPVKVSPARHTPDKGASSPVLPRSESGLPLVTTPP